MHEHRKFESVDRLERRLFQQTRTHQYRAWGRPPAAELSSLWRGPAATTARQVAMIGAVSLVRLIV